MFYKPVVLIVGLQSGPRV